MVKTPESVRYGYLYIYEKFKARRLEYVTTLRVTEDNLKEIHYWMNNLGDQHLMIFPGDWIVYIDSNFEVLSDHYMKMHFKEQK